MSKFIRKLMTQEICKKLEKISHFMVVSYAPMSGEQNHLLRGKLHAQGITIKMMKNSLAGVAIEQIHHRDMKKVLHGPCAIVYGKSSPVDLAKILLDISKKTKQIKVLGGYFEGKVLSDKQVEILSKVPPKEVLLAGVASALDSPFQQILRCTNGAAQKLSNIFNSLSLKLEKPA